MPMAWANSFMHRPTVATKRAMILFAAMAVALLISHLRQVLRILCLQAVKVNYDKIF